MSATPTVYFIDDSATMREVIKIAFRRENINVVAYNDANSALSQIEINRPDVVITDVIMPDKDGYEVCQFIKQSATLSDIPVILMSGVVNKSVAEKAFSVKADELIRKPFQPQDLITRVRHLLKAPVPAPPPAEVQASAAAALSSIFQTPASAMTATRSRVAPATAAPTQPPAPVTYAPAVAAAPMPAAVPVPRPAAPAHAGPAAPDMQKLRLEMMRLEGLVKKLQSELAAEREYSKALEAHVKTLAESE
ncbi:MAG: response regulator [Acidobacteriales bacterium]|nr:response regulator [Terriglobales bacterium]